MYLSIVVPCMNEEDGIDALVTRLSLITAKWKQQAKIILVDDGSSDGTWREIEAACKTSTQVVGIKLSANRGHQIALTAGLKAAKGERIMMIDADLQDPPELMTDMMFMMDRGFDVVYGRRIERQGETKYPLRKMIRFSIDAMTAFSTKPLKLATRLSFVSLFIAALMAVYVFRSLILFQTAPGWASVVLAVAFFSGVQLLTLGILGEYVGRLYIEAKKRPLYFVSEELRSNAPIAAKLTA